MKEIFQLFSCCKIVRGNNRSIVCDLQRDIYYPIPNILYDILDGNDIFSISDLIEFYGSENKKYLINYFDYLVSKDLGFYTNTPNTNLISINTEKVYSYNSISNAIVEYSDEDNLKKTIENLTNLNCEAIELRIYENIDYSLLVNILNHFQNSSIRSLYLLLKFSNFLTKKELLKLKLSFSRIKSIIIHSSPKEILHAENEYNFNFTKQIIDNNKICGIINQYDFVCTIKTFTEFNKYNSCLNKKIAVDKLGNIKNCPSMPQSFGNIKDITLQEALTKTNFQKYWNITKDEIEVCKDCEFRYICTDCRAYTEQTNVERGIDLSKPLKCGYSPYTNDWEEWSTNPIKQKAIEFYEI